MYRLSFAPLVACLLYASAAPHSARAAEARYIKLINAGNGKVLAVEDDSYSAGSHAIAAKEKDTTDKQAKAQQWRLEKDGDHYKLANRQSDLVLDVESESLDDGGSIIVWDDKAEGADNQRWSLDLASVTKPGAIAATDPGQRIKSKSSGLVLDVDNDGQIIQRAANQNSKTQLWRVVVVGQPKYFKLMNTSTGKVLGIENDSDESTAKAMLMADNNSADRQWQPVAHGDSYKFVNRKNGKVLDVEGGQTDEDVSIILYDDKSVGGGDGGPGGLDNQRWNWDAKASDNGKTVRIKSKFSGLVLDIDGQGYIVQRSANDSAKGQQWRLVGVLD
jgi:hypothetical protein